MSQYLHQWLAMMPPYTVVLLCWDAINAKRLHLAFPYLILLHPRAVGRKQEGEGRGAVETAAKAALGTPWLGEPESEDEDSDEWGEDEGLEERDDEASYCTH